LRPGICRGRNVLIDFIYRAYPFRLASRALLSLSLWHLPTIGGLSAYCCRRPATEEAARRGSGKRNDSCCLFTGFECGNCGYTSRVIGEKALTFLAWPFGIVLTMRPQREREAARIAADLRIDRSRATAEPQKHAQPTCLRGVPQRQPFVQLRALRGARVKRRPSRRCGTQVCHAPAPSPKRTPDWASGNRSRHCYDRRYSIITAWLLRLVGRASTIMKKDKACVPEEHREFG
jgi:hypothetical protein